MARWLALVVQGAIYSIRYLVGADLLAAILLAMYMSLYRLLAFAVEVARLVSKLDLVVLVEVYSIRYLGGSEILAAIPMAMKVRVHSLLALAVVEVVGLLRCLALVVTAVF
mmetsp:Transcript_46099/g.71960  ORF Transcript_46099/g.71960 Transcript_46099/m.71960 type:complete len:111 (+) Transcript_46099:103-435(+)